MDEELIKKQTDVIQSDKQVKTNKWVSWLVVVVVSLFIILAGAYTGFYLALPKAKQLGAYGAVSGQNDHTPSPPDQDVKTFRDRAEGVIERHDVNDPYAQGTHKLVREGGPSQTAYLVSSVVDLDAYVGKRVEVWGETQASTKVGWLMDVGKVNILE